MNPEAEDERAELERWLGEETLRVEERKLWRDANAPQSLQRPDEPELRRLDSTLKKTQAFIKKLKSVTETQRGALCADFAKLNLSKYVEEIAASLVEVKLKMSDVSAAVALASLTHQRYAEFSQYFLDLWKKALPRKKTDKVANASKLRVDLRFFADLITAGVFPDTKEALQILGGVLSFLVALDKKDHANLPTIVAFLKFCGLDYTGVVPRSVRVSAAAAGLPVPRPDFLPVDKQAAVLNLIQDYYGSVVERVEREGAEVRRLSSRNRRLYFSKGEVFEDAEEALKEARAALDKTLSSAKQVADLLDKDPPIVPLDAEEDEESGSMIVNTEGILGARGDEEGGGGLWEDEDTRQFYETIPELKAILPSILYKESMEAELKPVNDGTAEEALEDMEAEVEKAAAAALEVEKEAEKVAKADVVPGSASAALAELEEEQYGPRDDYPDEPEAEEEVSGSTMKLMMDAYLKTLPTLVNRDLIDRAATDFVTNLNTKGNRKRLTRELFDVPRTRLDLLPFYSRLVGILNPVMPDLGTELSDWLRCQFKAQLRRKDQIKIESKIKTTRFIGELVKFGIFPKSEALFLLKTALFDFRHHAIDVSCALLECCGYFLFHSPDSHHKTKLLLDLLMRKRSGLSDHRYQLMIDNAFYATNPPPLKKVERKERPPLHQYIRQLLFKDLSKSTVERVLKQMRKLDWANPEKEEIRYALKALASPHHIKFSSIQWLASVLSGLTWYHDWVGFSIVDAVLEDVRVGMEANDPRLNQRRLAALRYLAELYNYRVVDSAIIFSTLYSLLFFGTAATPEAAESSLDPPPHLFRIRLVATLLASCGEYFSSGSSGRKLDCFFNYLQRYYWRKRECPVWQSGDRPFPIEIQHIVLELLEELRPKLKPFESLEEAEAAVSEMEAELREQVSMPEPEIEMEGAGLEGGGLSAIAEEGEEERDELRGRRISFSPEDAALSSEEAETGQESGPGGSSPDDTPVTVRRATSGPDEPPGPEDEAFLAALDKMMSDAVVQRVQEAPSVPAPDISVPAGIRAKIGRRTAFAEDEAAGTSDTPLETPAEGEDAGGGGEQVVRLSLLTRGKGGKVVAKGLHVPRDSDFVQLWRQQEAAELAEKERIKAATLSMSRRMAEEEAEAEERAILGLSTSDPRPHGQKDKKTKFYHPKGAPSTKELFTDNWNK